MFVHRSNARHVSTTKDRFLIGLFLSQMMEEIRTNDVDPMISYQPALCARHVGQPDRQVAAKRGDR